MTSSRDLQRTAVRVLADLLAAPDLPEVRWHVGSISGFLHLFTDFPEEHELLSGQAQSHQTVREWATHLGTQVQLRFNDTPEAVAVIGGIGVRVWCAPEYRDDVNASEK